MDRRKWLHYAGLGSTAFLTSTLTGEAMSGISPSIIDSEDWINLGANENPYGPFPESRRQMKAYLNTANRYPSLKEKLIGEIAQKMGLDTEYIMLGAGSSEILGLATLLFLQKGGELLTATPTFRIWMNMARALGAKVNAIPLDEAKKHDLGKMNDALNGRTAMVYICNPNNPSGTELEYPRLVDFVRATSKKSPVLVDEVYHDFSEAPSLAGLTQDIPNLVVSRSFSKIYGLAGMRIGYGVAHPDTIKKLKGLQPWSGVSVTQLSLAAALGALMDKKTLSFSMEKNKESLKITTDFLKDRSLRYIPTKTNLLYFSLERIPEDYLERMKANKIIVREVKEAEGRWSRVSMGTPAQMKIFCEHLDAML